MCFAIPMCIIEIDGFNARCHARGSERQVSLFLMQHESLAPGDMVVVHKGNATAKVTSEDAKIAWQLYDEMLAAENGEHAELVRLKKPDDHAKR